MAGLKQTFLFGYSKSSVHNLLKSQEREYESRLQSLQQENDELKKTVESYTAKELLVAEALTEAKRLSRGIQLDSELEAEEIVRLTEESLENRVQQFEKRLHQLDETRQSIIDHAEYMKVELKQLLYRQLEMIDQIDASGLNDEEKEVSSLLSQGEILLETSRQLALGKEFKTGEEQVVQLTSYAEVIDWASHIELMQTRYGGAKDVMTNVTPPSESEDIPIVSFETVQ